MLVPGKCTQTAGFEDAPGWLWIKGDIDRLQFDECSTATSEYALPGCPLCLLALEQELQTPLVRCIAHRFQDRCNHSKITN